MAQLPCHEKVRFTTGAKARSALDGIRKRPFDKREGKPKKAYPCEHCGGYHLTSQDYEE